MKYNLIKMREEDSYRIVLSLSNSYLYYHNSKYCSSIVDHFTQLAGGRRV